MPQTGLFYNNFQKDIDLKSGRRGFQAGPTSNKKTSDVTRLTIPLGTGMARNGRHLPNRRDW